MTLLRGRRTVILVVNEHGGHRFQQFDLDPRRQPSYSRLSPLQLVLQLTVTTVNDRPLRVHRNVHSAVPSSMFLKLLRRPTVEPVALSPDRLGTVIYQLPLESVCLRSLSSAYRVVFRVQQVECPRQINSETGLKIQEGT